MRKVKLEAKSKGAVVATGEATQFDSFAEASKMLGGDDKAMGIINLHMRIRTLDTLRKGTAAPGFSKLFKSASPEAQKRIMDLLEKEGVKAIPTK